MTYTVSKSDGTAVLNRPSSFNANFYRCFKCQGFDRIASDCPNRKIVSLVEEEIVEKDGDGSNV